jgi:hypothetical protein
MKKETLLLAAELGAVRALKKALKQGKVLKGPKGDPMPPPRSVFVKVIARDKNGDIKELKVIPAYTDADVVAGMRAERGQE